MNKIKVSVIIPVYNSEEYLEECITSILNQNLKDIEIICVNDGSTDNSPKILSKFKKYDNVRIINQKNMGVIGARKKGLENAHGEYIAWVDSDDFIEKDMYEKMYDCANKNNLDVVICNYNFYPNNKTNKQKWYKSYNGGNINYNFIQQNTILWNKIVNKELLDKLNFIDLLALIGESAYAFVLINAKKIATIDECLYNYRIGHGSLSSNFKKIEWFEKVVEHQINKMNYARENNYSLEWQEFFTYNYLYYSCILMVVGAYNDNKKVYLENNQIIKKYDFFSKKYNKYLKNDISRIKILFLKYFAKNSFLITKIVSKIVL